MHRFILHNDQVCAAADRTLSAGQVGLMNGWGVFSTIRVIDGVLFAFERHWERMRRDAALLHVPFPARPEHMQERLLELVSANQAFNATLRVIVVRNHGGLWEGPGIDREFDLIAFTTDERRWGAGVRLGIVPNARHAGSPFAGTKTLSWSHNLTWLEQAQSHGLDEVILLNQHGNVCECTSANVFLMQGSQIWTPPLSSGCLPGVTRQLLLTEIRVGGITIGEKDFSPAELEAADEVFITSTTRGLLPVLSVEGLRIHSGGGASAPVRAAFARYVEAYVADVKSKTAGSVPRQT